MEGIVLQRVHQHVPFAKRVFFYFLLVMVAFTGIVHGQSPGTTCGPDRVELSCHPDLGLVFEDGSPADGVYKMCAKRTCHTDTLIVPDATLSPLGNIPVGGTVNIACNAGKAFGSIFNMNVILSLKNWG